MSKPLPSGDDSWASAYEADFQRIAHVLSIVERFALVPVEVPSLDVGRALAKWLAQAGFPIVMLEPRTQQEWENLTPALFEIAGPADKISAKALWNRLSAMLQGQPERERLEKGAVIVLGHRDEPEGMMAGLRLLNQRRDALGRRLDRALLWCGPKEFLDATWRGAPDFWSVADVPKRILLAHGDVPPYPIEWAGREIVESIDELQGLYNASLEHKDWQDVLRTGLRLAEKYATLSDFSAAHEQTERASMDSIAIRGRRTGQAGTYVHGLMRGRLAMISADLTRAQSELIAARVGYSHLYSRLDAAIASVALAEAYCMIDRLAEAKAELSTAIKAAQGFGDKQIESDAKRVLGHVLVQERRFEEAESAYTEALALARSVAQRRCEAHVLRGMGDVHLVSDRLTETEELYNKALSIYRDLGDRLGEANSQKSLGEVFLCMDRKQEAASVFIEAQKIYADIGLVEAAAAAQARAAAAQAGIEKPATTPG